MAEELDMLLECIDEPGGFRDACTVFLRSSVVEALEDGMGTLSENCRMLKINVGVRDNLRTSTNPTGPEVHDHIFVKGKELWGHIAGTDPTPDSEKEKVKYVEWEMKNAQIMSWIFGSVEHSMLLNLKPYKSCREMWDYLKKFYQIIQHKGSNWNSSWVNSVKALRGEFEAIRSNLMNREPVPFLDICVRELLREEQRIITQCYSCKGFRHIATTCIKKFCNYCKKTGHIIKDCSIRPPKKSETAYNVSVGFSNALSPSQSSITLEMIQQMIVSALSALGLLGNQNSIPKPWYFDSVTSNHMTNIALPLNNVQKYKGNLHIRIADGNPLSITVVGDISAILNIVFVSPKLSTNLIFVGQLVDNNCDVHFSKSGCLVQDQVSRKMITKGPKVGRLFPLLLSPSPVSNYVACNVVQCDNQTSALPSLSLLPHFPEPSTLVQRFKPGYVYHRRIPASDPSIGLIEVPSHLPATFNHVLPTSYDPSPLRKRPYKALERYGFSNPMAMSTTLSSISIPSCYKQAREHECWQQAMKAELQALEANHTWDIISCPLYVKPIGSKWVYTVKLKSDGSLDRYKARLVALGNKQEYGFDYEETFTPVAKMTTVRTILAIAASKGWPLHQIDVKNAFLYRNLKEEIYMKLAPGMSTTASDEVCKLRRSLYELKQVPRDWFEKFRDTLLTFSFTQSQYDSSLFFYKTITGMDLIKLASLKDATAVDTPIEVNVKYRKDKGELLPDPFLYRKLVGSLIYLTITRPDISYVVHIVSKFMQAPRHLHIAAIRLAARILGSLSQASAFFFEMP
ncbi:hypothetical protein NC651_000098 [Populus alba x Populus x berolinensis]|nr:hypothetical protein NC651_000098 [Populus alba x Populus x berolinensis]